MPAPYRRSRLPHRTRCARPRGNWCRASLQASPRCRKDLVRGNGACGTVVECGVAADGLFNPEALNFRLAEIVEAHDEFGRDLSTLLRIQPGQFSLEFLDGHRATSLAWATLRFH